MTTCWCQRHLTAGAEHKTTHTHNSWLGQSITYITICLSFLIDLYPVTNVLCLGEMCAIENEMHLEWTATNQALIIASLNTWLWHSTCPVIDSMQARAKVGRQLTNKRSVHNELDFFFFTHFPLHILVPQRTTKKVCRICKWHSLYKIACSFICKAFLPAPR